MNAQERFAILIVAVLLPCLIPSCASTRIERASPGMKTQLEARRNCILRTAADTVSFSIEEVTADSVTFSRLVMRDGKGGYMDVPPRMLETLGSTAMTDLSPATVHDLMQDSLRIPLTDILQMQTYELDVGRSALSVGLGLAATTMGLLLLAFESGLLHGSWR